MLLGAGTSIWAASVCLLLDSQGLMDETSVDVCGMWYPGTRGLVMCLQSENRRYPETASLNVTDYDSPVDLL